MLYVHCLSLLFMSVDAGLQICSHKKSSKPDRVKEIMNMLIQVNYLHSLLLVAAVAMMT